MKIETLKIRSSVKPKLKKYVLFGGTFIALIGIIPLVYSGAFLPVSILKTWGLPIFFFAGAMILFGLLPYRKLTHLETNPLTIEAHENSHLCISQNGIDLLSIPLESINSMKHIDGIYRYGILLWIHSMPGISLNKQVYKRLRPWKKKAKRYNADIFLPNFTKRSFQMLENFLQP